MSEPAARHGVVPYTGTGPGGVPELRCTDCQRQVVRDRGIWRHTDEPRCATPRPYSKANFYDQHETRCLSCDERLVRLDGVWRHVSELLERDRPYRRPPESEI